MPHVIVGLSGDVRIEAGNFRYGPDGTFINGQSVACQRLQLNMGPQEVATVQVTFLPQLESEEPTP